MSWTWMLLALLVTGFSRAQAAALLKPTSGAPQVLRARGLEIDSQIDGAWAQTTVTTTFARRGKQSLEADLLLSVPQDAIVTGFSYWVGAERVPAKLSPRETEAESAPDAANETQSAATTVDSVWSPFIGQNVFRAHLHRVVPGRDLRVELKMAQPLHTEGTALVWNYPLLSESRDVTLDWLRLHVTAPEGGRARNNFGAGVEGREWLAKKYNFKPKTDARISLFALPKSASPPILQAQMTSEHLSDATDEAFFNLTLQSPSEVAGEPKIEGVETFEVLPIERLSPTEVRIAGRYRGKGAATVSWGALQTVVWFAPKSDAESELHRVAAPVWGAARLAQIETAAQNGEKTAQFRGIALAKRFHIDSPWTSWIAIPLKERLVLEAAEREADLRKRGASWGRVWAMQIEKEQPLSASALQARANLRALTRSSLGRKIGFDEEWARDVAIKTRLAELGRVVMAGRMGVVKNDPAATQAMTKLAAYSEADFHPYLQVAQLGLRRKQVAAVKARWQNEVIALRGSGPLAAKLRAQLTTLENRYGMSEESETVTFKRAAQQMATSTLGEALAGRENQPRAGVFIEAGERFTKKCGGQSFRREFYEPTINATLGRVGATLLEELEAGRDSSEAARDAQSRLRQIYALMPGARGSLRQKGSLEWQIDAARRGLALETAYRLAQTKATQPDDRKTLSELQTQLERVASYTEVDSDEFLRVETRRFNRGQPLRSAHQFRLEESGLDPDDDNSAAPTQSEPQIENRTTDPLLSLSLPRDVSHVEVHLPSGETQNLRWNAQTSRWETRFYAPRTLQDGRVILGLRIVKTSGLSSRLTLNLAFDAATSRAQGLPLSESVAATAVKWDLGVWSQNPAQRIKAILPWHQEIALPAEKSGRFGTSFDMPAAYRGRKAKVQFLIVDESQKLSEISVDWN